MTDTTDNEARATAIRAMDRIQSHEEFCKERAARADQAEREIKESIRDVAQKVSGGLERLHARLDATEKQRGAERIKEASDSAKLVTRQNMMWAGLATILSIAAAIGVKYFFG